MDFNKLFERKHIDISSSKILLDMKTSFQSALGPVESARTCSQFLQLENFQEMFTLLWNSPAAHKCFEFKGPLRPMKVEEASKLCREQGNKFYKLGNFDEALKLYNLGILLAPHPKLPFTSKNGQNGDGGKNGDEKGSSDFESLALGYANRSAIFFSLKDYKRCLVDIDLALKYGYPNHLRSKLIERKERCVKEQKKSRVDNFIIKSVNAKCPPKLARVNPDVPAFSSFLKVIHTKERGRHVVTTRDIPPGEVIAVDSGYVSFIRYNQTMMQACSECLMRCEGQALPCPDCLTVFCSEDCRTKGLAGVHARECKILPYLMELQISDEEVCNAFRTIIHTTFRALREKLPVLQREAKELPPEKFGFDENGIYSSSDYRSVYHISAYNNKKPIVKLYNYCIIAFILTKILHRSKSFFIDELGNAFDPSDEDYIATGTALLYQFAHNSVFFEVSDMKVCTQTNKTDNQGVGSALFPSVWLIRHACNPNAAHYNIGSVRVVRSVMSIPKGSEVTLLYSEGYQHLPLSTRKAFLQARGIKCSCQACTENWLTEAELPEDMKMKCVKCSDPIVEIDFQPACMGCNIQYAKTSASQKDPTVRKFWSAVEEVSSAEHKYEKVLAKIGRGNELSITDLQNISNFIIAIEKHVSLPCRAFCKTRTVMMQYFMRE
ncbi:SET and MYND domain-containing protein 4-like [Macrobrachium nipponense]|uniref:SET and MYND domain-containing protein 4-like n=1 Tax=Macrobrachium nipponense TaxID=159736 RepID=UPI0030C7ED33